MNQIEQITYHLAILSLEEWLKNYNKKILTINHMDTLFPNKRPIHAVMQSLLTSFGSFWEKLAEAIATQNNYIVRNKKEFNKSVPVIPNTLLALKNNVSLRILSKDISIEEGIREIKKFIEKNNFNNITRTNIEKGKGIDNWFEKGNEELIADIKSPQENVGNAKKLIEHMLIWSASRLLDRPNTSVKTLIVIPYNPFPDIDTYERIQGIKMKPLSTGKTILIGDQFWDKISNQKNTTKLIFNTLEKVKDAPIVNKIDKLMLIR